MVNAMTKKKHAGNKGDKSGESFKSRVQELCSFIPYFESEGASTRTPKFSEFCKARMNLTIETLQFKTQIDDLDIEELLDGLIMGHEEELGKLETADYMEVLWALQRIQRIGRMQNDCYTWTSCIKNGTYLAILRRLNALLKAGQIP
jgi:hypothetical protein